jgi:dATP pyrophosphohydrolase
VIARVEVMVHVRRGDEFLVLRRSQASGGYWHSVAGGVEEGEEPEDAGRRELREEIGLEAGALVELAGFEYVRESWEPLAGGTCRVAAFLADAPPGFEPELNHEHDEHRWCTKEDALELLRWPEPREVLRPL